MASFGKTSRARLGECHLLLQEVMEEAILHFDFTVVCGYRSFEDQEKRFAEGASQLRGGKSKHNVRPSNAIDIAPWYREAPHVRWDGPGVREDFTLMAGIVLGVAGVLGIALRWGGNWNRDNTTTDNKFDDLPHFELIQ